EVANIRKIRGGLLVEVLTEKQSKTLLNVESFTGCNVRVSPHASLNYSKGVITCPDLLNCSTADIERELKDQGVIAAKRITTRRNGFEENTTSIVLTFDRPNIPQKVKAAMYVLPVRLYVPSPLRCFKCQKFGHTSHRCNNEPMCSCGRKPHEGSPCTEPFFCLNCKGNHRASSRNCPEYKEEVAIQKLMTEKKVGYIEAKREFRKNNGYNFSKSFAQITAQPKNVNNATEITAIVEAILPQVKKMLDQYFCNITQTLQSPKVLRKTHTEEVKQTKDIQIHNVQTNSETLARPIHDKNMQATPDAIDMSRTNQIPKTHTITKTILKNKESQCTDANMNNQYKYCDKQTYKEEAELMSKSATTTPVSLNKILIEPEKQTSKMTIEYMEDSPDSDENFFSVARPEKDIKIPKIKKKS
ncbi:hypothetical protein KM043_018810, partial [Ampulex compressa]